MREAVMCFVFIDGKLLMINRNRPPFMGMWNVVGGKVERGETPEQACVREVFEESGIKIVSPERVSRFTWNYDDEIGYAFTVRVEKPDLIFPVGTEEGIVDLKPIPWVLSEKNYGVIADLRVFLKDIEKNEKHDYHLIYDGATLTDYVVK
ncbi:MAG: NUDIX domain-containing protein [Clostridia bacterium]|nr:NUDIX domain-containing protein [Clostridia bacterium]